MSNPWSISQGGFVALVTILGILVMTFVTSAAVSYRRKAGLKTENSFSFSAPAVLAQHRGDTHKVSQLTSYHSVVS